MDIQSKQKSKACNSAFAALGSLASPRHSNLVQQIFLGAGLVFHRRGCLGLTDEGHGTLKKVMEPKVSKLPDNARTVDYVPIMLQLGGLLPS